MQFTQDEINLAANVDELSFDDYLIENPEITLIEDELDGDPPSKKQKGELPTESSIDKLLGLRGDNKVETSNIVDLNEDTTALEKDLIPKSETAKVEDDIIKEDLDLNIDLDIDLKKPKKTIKERKLLNKTRNTIEDLEAYEFEPKVEIGSDGEEFVDKTKKYVQGLGDDINRGQWIIKTNSDETKSYYKLEDIIKDDFDLLKSLQDNDYDLKKFIKDLGSEYEFFSNEEVLTTEDSILDEVIITGYKNWKDKALKSQTWENFFDLAITNQIFNDEEGEAAASLDLLLPEGFKTRQVAIFRDKVEIIAPNGVKKVFQVDLSLAKPKQQEKVVNEISELKKFVNNNRRYKDDTGNIVNPEGWTWDSWKQRIGEVKADYLVLTSTPSDQGGVGLTNKEKETLVDKYNTNFILNLASKAASPDAYDIIGVGEEETSFALENFNEAILTTNLFRKSKGLDPLKVKGVEFSSKGKGGFGYVTILPDGRIVNTYLNVEASTDEETGEYYPAIVNKTNPQTIDENGAIKGSKTFYIGMDASDFNEIQDEVKRLSIKKRTARIIERNVEDWAETNPIFASRQQDKNMGFGIAGSAINSSESKFLFQAAEAESNVKKVLFLEARDNWENLPNKNVIENFFKNDTFANYNTSSAAAQLMSVLNTSIIPEDENGIATEDIYVKIQGRTDDKGNELMFLIKKGEAIYSKNGGSINFNPKKGYVSEDGSIVAMIPISNINSYNNANYEQVKTQGIYYKKVNELTEAISDLPNFADQVEAWDKNYNELENFGVTLGISGLSLAKNLTVGAAALTMYLNPSYWGGKIVGIDAFEGLAQVNTYLSKLLEQEKQSYNFSMSTFDEGDMSSWEGFKAYVEWTSNMFADTLPIMAAMILSGGSSSYAAAISSSIAGISSVGAELSDIDLENDRIEQEIKTIKDSNLDTDSKKIKIKELEDKKVAPGSFNYMAPAVMMGSVEFLGSFMTTGQWAKGMNKIIFKNSAATKALHTNWGQKLKAGSYSWLKESNTEGLGESFVTFGDNLIHGRPLSTGLLEAYAGGFAITGLLDGAGKGYSATSTTNYASNKEIKDLSATQKSLFEQHQTLDKLDAEINILKTPEAPGVPVDAAKYQKLNELRSKKIEVESEISNLKKDMEVKVEAYKNKLQSDGMRLLPASMYAKNQKRLSELRTKAMNLAADPSVDKEGSEANIELAKINSEYKTLENLNQAFLSKDSFGHEWFARKAEGLSNKDIDKENKIIEDKAIKKIQEKLDNPNYVPSNIEIDTEAVKIVDEQVYEQNNTKAAIIADQGGWNYNNNSTNKEGIKSVELAYDEAIKNADPNEMVKAKAEDGSTVEMPLIDYLESKKQKAIEGVKEGSVNGFFDETINTQFNFKENAVKNQKVGVPLHEGAHGATKKLIKADPKAFEEQSKILVEFLKTQQADVFAKMQVEGTNGLRVSKDGPWDFEEVFSSFVEEVAAGNIDLEGQKDFTAFFGMKLNEGLMKSSNGKYRVDFKGTNDISNFFVKLGQEIGMGEVSLETIAELDARAEDQGGEVIDINRDKERVKVAASETKLSKSDPSKSELVAENKKLLKDKPKGFMDTIKANAAKIKSMLSGSASAPSSTLSQKEPASDIAKKAKKRINEAVDKIRSKIPSWKEGNRQKPNRVLDKLFNDIGSDLDGMIAAKAKNFVTNDKSVVDLTQNVDLKELQQAVKTELLADIRGFNKNNDSLYGYINSRLKQRIGDVLPDLWTDMSQKDIDNLGTSDTKTINENKPLIESVPDVNLRNSLDIELGSPLSDLVLETVEKVLGTKMPEFKYVRKNKGGKRTNVDLASVKKVLESNPTGETKRQAERDLAGIYKQFTSNLENRFSEELRDAFVETFGSRADYTDWLDINADAISDLSIEKLVAFERLVKGEKIFTEVVKENLSVEEVKQLEGTGLLVSATTNQGPTLYKKLNPSKQQVIDFFDIKGSKKGTRKDALADKISGELALNATMEIASKPEVMEKFELGLENSGTGEIVTKAYLDDVSKAIGRGVDLKFSRSFDAKENVPIELKNTYKNGRKRFVDVLKKMGITDQNVDAAWQEVFGDTDFAKTKKGRDEAKGLIKEWKSLSKQISEVESILASEVQMEIINSVIDEVGGINDTERAEIIAKARREALLPTRKGRDFDDIVKQLAKNLGIKNGFAYEQLVYDATDRAVSKWSKENGKESALKIEGIRGEEGGKADFIATIGGNAFNVELKLNNARFGSVGVITNTDAKGNINFDLTKDYSFNEDLLKMVYSANPDVKAWVDKANEIGKEKYGDSFLKYDFGDIIDKEVLAVLQGDGFQSRIQRKIVLSAESVGEGYIVGKNNGTAYMNISKLGDFKGERRGGLYKLRNPLDTSLEDPANLGGAVPYLDGEATWSLAIAKTTADSKNGPTKYKKAGIKLVDGKLPGSRGWANANLRIQVTKLDGLPESKIDMSTEPGLMDLQNLAAVQDLDVKKGEASGVNIKNNSDSKVVPDFKMSKTTNPESLRQAEVLDRALEVARDPNAPIKKIRVFDFDDTLARTKSNVLYTMPDGTTGKLTAEEFAKKGDAMLAEGAVWDFSEFNKVMEGKKGPLFEVAQKIQETRGTDDVFVLTARAAEAAPAIKEFLDSVGLEIPIENITGLGDSSPLAKSGWMVDKAAEGYNDFYFADDHLGNVDAVDIAMSVIDVKSKTQQAKIKFSKSVGDTMNDIIYDKTGIESYKEYSSMRAKAKGRTKRSFSLIPSSAQDFGGLLYKLLAKGEKGDAQWQWMQDNLVKPFSRAMNDLSVSQNQLMNDFRELKKSITGIPTNLKKKAFGGFTYEDITRIAAWDRQGINVDGLSKRDLQQIQEFVNDSPEISLFVDQLIELSKGDGYHYPGGDWLAGTITTDFMQGLRKDTRPRLLEQWSQNIDLAFDEKTFNKLEAAFGPKYVEALKDSIRRMKTGQNRKEGTSRLEARFQDYINNSVGAVMFLNARSAVLQTISAANFVNWTDNNPLKAGKAFANQKQYWKDFMSLMNSDFLVDRRNGLKINVSESEIAEAAKTTGNSVKSVISYLLTKGFALTQFADSFAIATGGATFYRNRVNTYIKQGLSRAEAEKKAFLDFRDTAEESQQSARADKISQQQASTLGRIVLSFANTPSQYARIMDKAGRDLVNGRGDAKSNISKIMYYGFVQNLMFTALQSALFATGFGEDEEDVSLEYFKNKGYSDKEAKQAMDYYNSKDSKKDIDVANSMLDNIMRGLGVQGVILATAKNTLLDLYRRSQKEGTYPGPKYDENAWKLLEVSPPISIKAKKYKGGMKDFEMNSWRPEAKEPFNINNPSYRATAKVIAAVTNVPLDRVFQKIENVQGVMDETNESWQRVAMLLGWPKWQLENNVQQADRFAKEKEGRKQYRAEQKKKTTRQYKPQPLQTQASFKAAKLKEQSDSLFKLNKSVQIDSLRKLGLTTDAIKRLKYEKDRVNKIIELSKK